MSPADLDGVATFYNLIFRKPVGRHVVMLCDSVSCWIMGYERMREHLTSAIGDRVRRNHGRQPLYSAAHRVSGSLRPCARHDRGQRPAWRPRSGQDRQASGGVQVAMTVGEATYPRDSARWPGSRPPGLRALGWLPGAAQGSARDDASERAGRSQGLRSARPGRRRLSHRSSNGASLRWERTLRGPST